MLPTWQGIWKHLHTQSSHPINCNSPVLVRVWVHTLGDSECSAAERYSFNKLSVWCSIEMRCVFKKVRKAVEEWNSLSNDGREFPSLGSGFQNAFNPNCFFMRNIKTTHKTHIYIHAHTQNKVSTSNKLREHLPSHWKQLGSICLLTCILLVQQVCNWCILLMQQVCNLFAHMQQNTDVHKMTRCVKF